MTEVATFSTGATRSADDGKIDPEAFLDPMVIGAFCDYMQRHRVQADGSVRDGDNWQKGFTRARIMKSLIRHALDLWRVHRGHEPISPDHLQIYVDAFNRTAAGFEDLHVNSEVGADRALAVARNTVQVEILCALYFNVGAYLREVLLGREVAE